MTGDAAQPHLLATEHFWSTYAPTFDNDPDHGLRDTTIRRAWAACLERWLPGDARRVADLGCGTGSLSLLLDERGHQVVGFDLARGMLAEASQKAIATGSAAGFAVAEVADPPIAEGSLDVVLCRHVLWALPDPLLALSRWHRLLKPTGRLVAIEGRWFTPAAAGTAGGPPWNGGVRATTLSAALEPHFARVDHEPLSIRADLWGRLVDDERYALITTGPR